MEIHYFARRIDADSFAESMQADNVYVSVERAGHQFAVVVEVRLTKVKRKTSSIFVK